jgi:hypothetical protein
MAEIVNLRQARKQKARAEAAKAADENRAKYGRGKNEKSHIEAQTASARDFLDGHRRDGPPTGKR